MKLLNKSGNEPMKIQSFAFLILTLPTIYAMEQTAQNQNDEEQSLVIVQQEEHNVFMNHFANIKCDEPFFGQFPIITAKHIDTNTTYFGHVNEQDLIAIVEYAKPEVGYQKLPNKKATAFYETMLVVSQLEATDLTRKKLLDNLHETLK